MLRIGIDLGGTNIVAGVVNDEYEIIAKAKTPTAIPRTPEEIFDDIAMVCKQAMAEAGVTIADIYSVGLGTPGTANAEGVIEYANNLGFDHVPAKDMLIERFEWICSQSPESAKFMYKNGLMMGYKPKEGIRSALKHGTLAIGQIALAETLQILIGKDHTTPEGMEIAKQIEQLFKTRCAQFKELYKLNFGVYYSPAENLCYTSLKKFREKYGVIPNVSDRDYFTNSIHVPVWKKVSPFEKIDIEAQLTGYSSAGCITYIELDSTFIHNTKAIENIIEMAI